MALEIRLAQTPPDREAVFRFRYEVLIEELGRRTRHADPARRRVVDPLDDTAHLLMAVADGRLVGTLRTNFLRDGGLGEAARVLGLPAELVEQASTTSVTSRAMVLASERGGTLFARLAKAVYRFGLQNGIAADLIVSRPELCDAYLRLGYRALGPEVGHPEVGAVRPLRLDLLDADHLAAVHSPFCPVLRAFLREKDPVPTP